MLFMSILCYPFSTSNLFWFKKVPVWTNYTLPCCRDRDRYVQGDYRFRHGYFKHNPRKMVKTWAEKEMRNLLRYEIFSLRMLYSWFSFQVIWQDVSQWDSVVELGLIFWGKRGCIWWHKLLLSYILFCLSLN